jgi:hypothetical protein
MALLATVPKREPGAIGSCGELMMSEGEFDCWSTGVLEVLGLA